jgi:multiple sugar transport system permease protein
LAANVKLPNPRKPFSRASLSLRKREIITGYLFLTPWIIGFLAFVSGPMIASAILSFTNYDMVNVGKFVGLDNYSFIFGRDELFWPSLLRTFRYAVIVVPISLTGSLLAAMLLN